MLQITNLKLSADAPQEELKRLAQRELGASVQSLTILRASVDARKKNDVHWVYSVAVSCQKEQEVLSRCRSSHVALYQPGGYRFPEVKKQFARPPVVVGAGPAGLFCALMLARAGARPILLERGRAVEQRIMDVARYRSGGALLPNSNLQFGEGGAGTFSDGKLNTGVNDPRMDYLKEQFVAFGAPETVRYLAAPHVGTDNLRRVVRNIRKELQRLGASVRFEHRLTGIQTAGGRITGLTVQSPEGTYDLPADQVCLAIGHSARDTFSMLYDLGVPMEQKRFAMGVRIEQLQADISRTQYGSFADCLPPASYKLSCHLDSGRSAYSFCVCPGGTVMAAASEPESVVTNGMSEYARDKTNINGALLVGVGPEDFPSAHPLAGVTLQRTLEHAAFLSGGSTGFAPAQRVEDFLHGRASTAFGKVTPSYLPGVTPADLHSCLPDYISSTIAQALPILGKKLPGYDDPDAVLTAVESRSSSPVRILRGEDGLSTLGGLYPCGEGAGYAGGILSAAADGLRCAERMLLS